MVEPSLPVRNISSSHWFCLIGRGFMQFLAQGGPFPPLPGFFQTCYSLVSTLAQKPTHRTTFPIAPFGPENVIQFPVKVSVKGLVVLGAGTPVGWDIANHIALTRPSPGYCWGMLSSHCPISSHWVSGMPLDKVSGHNYGVLKLMTYKDPGQADSKLKKKKKKIFKQQQIIIMWFRSQTNTN